MGYSVHLNDQSGKGSRWHRFVHWGVDHRGASKHPAMQVLNPKIKSNLSIMLLERLPEVQSLSVEDKWRLIDELWSDLAQEVERGGVDENTLALLNQRFEEHVQDPGQAQPLDACIARLGERKRRWK